MQRYRLQAFKIAAILERLGGYRVCIDVHGIVRLYGDSIS
jgi:hypothetical protein